MNKIILLFTLTFLIKVNFLLSQSIFLKCDSVLKLSETDYHKSKLQFISLQKKEKIPNQSQMFFLDVAFKNKDLAFFKEQIIYALKTCGLDFSKKEYYFLSYNQTLRNGDLRKWYIQSFNKYYPIWLKNNYKKLNSINRLNLFSANDQTTRRLLYSRQFDSLNIPNIVDSKVIREDFNNIIELIEICKEEGEVFPNDIDYPEIGAKIEYIILHNLKNKESFDTTWKMIYPYFENTYSKKKVKNDLCKLYDIWLKHHYNMQYYGTLSDGTKIKDSAGLIERKKKFNL